jgi:hypothetical protein
MAARSVIEVVDVVRRGHVRGALMRGYPLDALAPEVETQSGPSEYALVDVSGAAVYRVQGDRASEVLRRLRDPSDGLQDLVAPDEVFLDLPLALDKRFCEPTQLTRADGFYCWVVESEQLLRPIGIRGLPPEAEILEYQLRYQTLSGPVFLRFAPGVGITGFAVLHPSSRSMLDLALVEYTRGGSE